MSDWQSLRPSDFATKLTPSGTLPPTPSTPDEMTIWTLSNRILLVDTEAGVVFRPNGKRAEYPRPNGYGYVLLGKVQGKQKWARAHRVVWIAAHGPIPGMYEINHRNSRRWDNRIENLDMVTHAGNAAHAHLQPYEHVPGVPFEGPDDRPAYSLYATSAQTKAHGRSRTGRSQYY